MNENWLDRVLPIYKDEGIEKLKQSRVVIMGLGGVGSAAAEAICRSGVGNIMIVDSDEIDITNINRQLIANRNNVGNDKVFETEKRLHMINPQCNITPIKEFYLPENSDFVFNYKADYIIDAIDTVTAKLHLAEVCKRNNIPIISCLGTGNRLDPSKLKVGYISDTVGSGCPFARVMRRELKKRGIVNQTVVYSTEIPYNTTVGDGEHGRHSPCSTAFVPPCAGFLLASVVIRNLLDIK